MISGQLNRSKATYSLTNNSAVIKRLTFYLGAGGFYSDSKAFVSDECKKCPVGTFVPLSKWPGIRPEDCEACPQGIETLLAVLDFYLYLVNK